MNVKIMPDYLVVGAEFSGTVLAERIARHLGKPVFAE
jgi:UDP-galactopyranose mutase